ncbi:hypothetical protein RHECNPAF_1330061 [Rhizobium etli CNPAF512]|nr:hypothetical protein RHECNPAF_1330061 [Rhizobium etli CNPAF512]
MALLQASGVASAETFRHYLHTAPGSLITAPPARVGCCRRDATGFVLPAGRRNINQKVLHPASPFQSLRTCESARSGRNVVAVGRLRSLPAHD